ncbi:MAG: hypothetical protein ACOC10_09455 [Bacteroidota bacterium]
MSDIIVTYPDLTTKYFTRQEWNLHGKHILKLNVYAREIDENGKINVLKDFKRGTLFLSKLKGVFNRILLIAGAILGIILIVITLIPWLAWWIISGKNIYNRLNHVIENFNRRENKYS